MTTQKIDLAMKECVNEDGKEQGYDVKVIDIKELKIISSIEFRISEELLCNSENDCKELVILC